MDKLTSLDNIIKDKYPKAINILNSKSYTDYNRFLEIIAKEYYNLKEELNVSASTITKLLKDCFPDRIVSNSKLCNWLLLINNTKYCFKCKQVLDINEFHKNSATRDKLGTQCISCHYSQLKLYQPYVSAKRRAAKLNATPKWANLQKIKEIYNNCPQGYHVDHIIPLQGKNVCGLHVENNLQYLLARDNLVKSNKLLEI